MIVCLLQIVRGPGVSASSQWGLEAMLQRKYQMIARTFQSSLLWGHCIRSAESSQAEVSRPEGPVFLCQVSENQKTHYERMSGISYRVELVWLECQTAEDCIGCSRNASSSSSSRVFAPLLMDPRSLKSVRSKRRTLDMKEDSAIVCSVSELLKIECGGKARRGVWGREERMRRRREDERRRGGWRDYKGFEQAEQTPSGVMVWLINCLVSWGKSPE